MILFEPILSMVLFIFGFGISTEKPLPSLISLISSNVTLPVGITGSLLGRVEDLIILEINLLTFTF